MRRLCLVFLSIAALLAARASYAETPDDAFMRAYNLIQEADALSASNQTPVALKKYQQAENILITLHNTQPNWNSSVVSFRLDDVAKKLSSLAATPAGQRQQTSGVSAGSKAARAPASVSKVQVKLLEAGAAPRRKLRLQPKPGEKQSMTMTMTMGMQMQVGEMPAQETKLPAMKMRMATAVTDIAENGDITYELKFTDATVADGVESPAVAAMKTALDGFKGLSGTGKISNRGVVESSQMNVPPDAAPQLRQMMDQMKESFSNVGEPFPDEAVGPGAKWEVTMPIKSQGMTIQQRATYELVSLEAETVTMRSTLSQTAANQRIQNPSMPNMKVELTKMSGEGTGERTCGLGKILPVSAKLKLHSEMGMVVGTGAQNQQMTMKIDLDLQLEGK